MSLHDTAERFLDACETGKGWEGCRQWCHADAGFSAQSDALTGIVTLAGYCDWMRDLLVPLPDGRYELQALAVDEARETALAFAVFHGTHTADGPVPATGRSTASDYVYAMVFDGDRIRHMTKVWNDAHALRQLGWS